MGNSRKIPRWILLTALLAVVCVATGVRLYRLPEGPVGLHYDEAANGILAGEIARGLKTPIFIPSYTGKEVLYFYWTGIWMKFLGVTPLVLRLSSASIGVATVLITIWAVYELLYDARDASWIALVAAAYLAVSFWHLVLSRYGFRAVTQPLFQALTAAALWRGLRLKDHRQPVPIFNGWLLLAGLFCGLTAYTYLAARAFPLPLGVALITLVLADRRRRWQRLAQSGIFIGVAAFVLAPLAHYWLTHPGSFMTRANQVIADNWAAVGRGLTACLRMFFLEGDPYIRFNLPGRPLFGPVVAGLFLLGLGVTTRQLVRLLRVSDDPHRPLSLAARVFLLVLVPIMLLPSALATGEITPSNLRTVGLLPFVYVFPALGVWAVITLLYRLIGRKTSLKYPLFFGGLLLLLALVGSSVMSAYLAWSSSPALYYAADGDLADIADYLNSLAEESDLSRTKLYVASQHYRHPTLAFLAQDYDIIRWLVGGQTLVFPPEGDALFLFPRSAAQDLEWVSSMLPEHVMAHSWPGPDGSPAFYAYQVQMAQAPTPAHPLGTDFGGVAQLRGYAITNRPRSGESVHVTVWWRVLSTPNQPDYHPVARLADRWGSIWGARQPLHYPSEQWTEGELIVDRLSIPITPGAPPGDYVVRFGLYAPGVDARLPVVDDGGAYAGQYAELPVPVDRAAKPLAIEDVSIDHRLDAAVDGLTLLGIQLDTTTARPGETLQATLFWQTGDESLPPYELSLRLSETTLYRGAPVHDTYPFSEWAPGEIVADRYDPRLPLDVAAGQHRLSVQLGDQATVDLAEITVETTDRTFDIPPISHPMTVTLDQRVQLLGYDLSSDMVVPGETLTLTLTWRALTEMNMDYTVFTHLVAPDGSMTGQQDQQPMRGSYPTSLWAPREVVTDVYEIPVSAAATPGEHRLEVGMYIAETGTRLHIESNADNAVMLQRISVTD